MVHSAIAHHLLTNVQWGHEQKSVLRHKKKPGEQFIIFLTLQIKNGASQKQIDGGASQLWEQIPNIC